jgi:hypothetical protein
MNNAVRTRQRMLAVSLPLTAALYLGAEGVNPKGTDQLVTTAAIAFKVLPIAADHSSQLYASGSLTELALGAVAISYAAVAMLVVRSALLRRPARTLPSRSQALLELTPSAQKRHPPRRFKRRTANDKRTA